MSERQVELEAAKVAVIALFREFQSRGLFVELIASEDSIATIEINAEPHRWRNYVAINEWDWDL